MLLIIAVWIIEKSLVVIAAPAYEPDVWNTFLLYINNNLKQFKVQKKQLFSCLNFFNGGAEEDRTLYLLNANQALSQVSYSPKTIYILINKLINYNYFFIKIKIL